ncbi:MAG: carbohydrate binding domain-containing protein, partial [Acholeplasmatales bacterium]|nr:carbohydrate binding domain-containing protein [Acholeplasmatales bacterium]
MKKFLKLFLMPLMLGIVALSTIALTSCGEKEIVDVKVNETTVPQEIVQGTLDDEISKIKLVVTLSDNSTYEVAVAKDMLSAKDLEKLADIGTYNVTVTYEGFNVEIRLVIVEAEDNVELTDITLTVAEPNVEVEYGAAHSALTGVSAVGNDGVSYASKVTYKITNKAGQEVASVDTYQELEVYTVVISISYNGINKSVTKTVTVGAKPDTSGNLIPSGEFPMENGAYTGWAVYSDQSTVTYESEVIGGTTFAKVVEDVVSGFSYSPRLNNTTGNYFKLYAGTTYKISFQAKASQKKTIQCQVGQLVGGAPYFYDFAAQQFPFEIGTDMATYSLTFIASNNAGGDMSCSSVTFEMGKVGNDETVATIWLGNVVVEEFHGEIADTQAPVINASSKT